MGIKIPYLNKIIFTVAISLSFLLILKTNLRWQAIFKARKIKAFNISRSGWTKCVVYEFFQWVFYLFISFLLFNYFEKGWPIVIILVFFVLESVFHILLGLNLYKVVVEENAITMIDSNIVIVPWSEIVCIVKRHNDLQFKLTNNTIKLLDLDFIGPKDREEFQDKIKDIALNKNIFIEG